MRFLAGTRKELWEELEWDRRLIHRLDSMEGLDTWVCEVRVKVFLSEVDEGTRAADLMALVEWADRDDSVVAVWIYIADMASELALKEVGKSMCREWAVIDEELT